MSESNEANKAAKAGMIFTGTVLKIKPFGAIVSLPGNAPGLVHISQITNGFIDSVDSVLAVGDEVNVRVLSVEESTGKIALSMKDLVQNFGEDEFEGDDEEGNYYLPQPLTPAQTASFEEKFKSWQKLSNERIAGINRRNKRNKRR